ncbi:MAG TPA: tripartite tricarboxylate transporter substrate binding protein [Xanthobacteraceae bacterium]|nr:tripartite tricarboxylate transporter substrate binding protein [Xanthobacteraceae bacterium]
MKTPASMTATMMAAMLLTAAALLTAPIVTAAAQDFPNRPIRMIVPLTPGSGADIAGRIVGRFLSEAWHQPVVVENRAGAGGQIGTQVVAKADPDGYTLLVQSASHAANSAIYKSLPYDPLKDLVDVALLGVTPYVMVTAPDGPYKSLKALIDAAKANPGNIPFASAGVGSSTHLAAEYVVDLAGIKMLHVPYRGSPEAIQDTIAGRTAFYMAPINTAIGLVSEGRLAPLGISSRQRSEVLPAAVPLAEQGFPAYDVTLWFGMWAPAGTPPAVVQRLNAQVASVLKNREVVEQFGKLGIGPQSMAPEEFGRFVRSEIATYQRIVKQAAIPQQ